LTSSKGVIVIKHKFVTGKAANFFPRTSHCNSNKL